MKVMDMDLDAARQAVQILLPYRDEAERLRARLQRVRDWLKYAANSPGGVVAEIDMELAAKVERLQTIIKERPWRDATTVDPADGDRWLVAVRGSDNRTVWWDYEVVTVQIGEDYFMLEVNGDVWDCNWADVAWCIPMSAMQPPEAAQAARKKPNG